MPEKTDISKLYKSTALSKEEIQSIDGVVETLSIFGDRCSFVGNVAINSFIPAKYRGKVNMSTGMDVIVFKETGIVETIQNITNNLMS